jgi:hypothetical protein
VALPRKKWAGQANDSLLAGQFYSCVLLVEFRIPLNTTDKNQTTTYVDQYYIKSDHPHDMFDSMRAAMHIPKTYEHLVGVCLLLAAPTLHTDFLLPKISTALLRLQGLSRCLDSRRKMLPLKFLTLSD